jgi:hypothetical protein
MPAAGGSSALPVRRLSRRTRLGVGGFASAIALLLAGCGSATATRSAVPVASVSSAAAIVPAECAGTVAGALGEVGERIYHEAATGGNVAQAVHRLQSSAALASAVRSGDAGAAHAALEALLLNQIVEVEVLSSGHVLATAGSGGAIAPVSGSIPGTNARFILSVQADRTYLQVTRQVTGAQILLLDGTRRLDGTITGPPAGGTLPMSGPVSFAGQSFQVFSLAGASYPSGPLRVAVLVPSASITCPGSAAQARVETMGHVGERIYQEELHSKDVAATVRHIEGSASFRRAVAAGDPLATRAAIVSFFGQHIHVVRVRVTIGDRLLVDLGGPFVLAPVHGVVRSNGRVIGHFAMAIQDDAGYLKLAHLFTGAEVLMRTGAHQVMGTLSPGPASVPARGLVSYGGRSYEAYSFTGEAFPSGPLQLSLLLPS